MMTTSGAGKKATPKVLPSPDHITFPEGSLPRAVTYMHEQAAEGRADAYLKQKGVEGAANVVFMRPSEKEKNSLPFLDEVEEMWMVYGPLTMGVK